MIRFVCATLLALATSAASAASITDLNAWTQLQDPPHPGMAGVVDNASQVTLTATGAVPSGTDIGYASVNGPDVAGSTGGYYFDPAQSFVVAIDFDLSAGGSIGGGGIGFGIGEDVGGTDSAGVGLALLNGAPLLFSAASRVNDIDQPLSNFAAAATASGRLFVNYNAATGDITLGVNAMQGVGMASDTVTLAGLQNLWDDEPLLVSFFLRSQAAGPIPALTAGSLEAVFSNFEVLSGTPLTVVPEPASLFLTVLVGGAGLICRRR
ncbi:PEP-CTERM sorting domain-containing protein [Botrimarina hoheduenensis]|uniref:PEP-CTERM protein-sorting domain-containing protein n=1 Tax=Botrimarina hoheduenensis TaxID=2528000 RepID=A0A5C5VZ13_9BACT|nr:PEP-CTERM sorting domain-containing protein [Botrimarina hoheduenensis]TWT43203.1 hypothetical protein Pla111_21530 [Botrimarina hoheduenensis]